MRSSEASIVLACGGSPMFPVGVEPPVGGDLDESHASGSLLGKRYVDAPSGLEALCVKAGAGSLTVDDRPVTFREAKKLPSSD